MPTSRTRRATTSNKEKEESQGPAPDPTAALAAALEIFNDDFRELNLQGKIAVISGHLGRIPKNGHNKFNDYWYVLESDLVEQVRYYLAAARILIYPKEIRQHTVHTFSDQPLGPGERRRDIFTDNVVTYEVADGRTGATFAFEVNTQGSDPRDKGANKASTSGMKFAYIRLFNISSGEDEAERDEQGDARAAEQNSERTSPPKMEPAQATDAQRGGKQEKATTTQIRMVSNLSNELELGAHGLAGVIKRILSLDVTLPDDETKHGPTLSAFLVTQSGENVGRVIYALQEMVKAAKSEDDGSE